MAVSFLVGCGSNTTENSTDGNTQKTEETEKPEETTKEEETTVANSTPRNETLYFNGQQWGTINNWNPMSSNSNNAMAVQQVDSARVLIYETLFLYNMLDGSLQPLLGESYEWNADQSQLTVKLNQDAKWSDGTKVTAEDVAYTFNTHVKYGSTTGNDYGAYIEKVEATDEATVVFSSKLDDSGVPINPLKVIEYIPKVYVMQKAYLQTVEARNNNEADKVKEDVMDDLIASGPYKPYYNDDQKVVFVRDDNYWGTSLWGSLPAPKYIAHTIFADNAAGDVAFANGEVDVSQQFISEVWKMWESGKPISTYIDDAPYYVCATMPTAFFNIERKGLDKAEVRKAIAMAVDFNQIISTAMSGYSPTFKDVPRSLMNPTAAEQALVDQSALSDLQFTGKDIDGANKILDEAGIVDTDGDGIREIDGENLSYKAECPEGWSDWNASLEIVAAAGKEIGINIETYFPDANTFYDDMTTGKFDICMWSPPGASIANPWTRSMALLSSTYNELEVNWSGNYGGFTSEKADEILSKIPTEQDQAKLKEYYTELSKIYLEEVPSFSLMYRPQVFHTVNESVWTGFPQQDDGNNIPPLDCTDGYGVAALYHLKNVE
ncbi:ABC transporter substrate-binding protein [uncultured Clostridium sp.]|uniref:ABC transporter substrate-binding protein n=1 Tax=uncultured Clostridium sp. TaxID=59620 RepID=UPI002672ECDF|nr:ABC transporter substrate-binding protein [uncultured Clostridium sp.]